MSALKKVLGRRLFARAAIGTPIALKGAIAVPGSNYGAQPPSSPIIGMGTAADVAKQAFREKIWQRIRIDSKPEEETINIRWARRQALGGLDPDLSVLSSMSVVRRIQIQIDRDKEWNEKQRSFRSSIIRMMGGNPEDFE